MRPGTVDFPARVSAIHSRHDEGRWCSSIHVDGEWLYAGSWRPLPASWVRVRMKYDRACIACGAAIARRSNGYRSFGPASGQPQPQAPQRLGYICQACADITSPAPERTTEGEA